MIISIVNLFLTLPIFFYCIFLLGTFIQFLNSNTCIIVLLCWLHFVNLFFLLYCMVVIEKFDFWVWQWCERMVQHRMLFVQYNCNIIMLSFPSFEIFIKIKKRMKILDITCCWSCVETIGNPNFKYLHFHEYLFFLCFLFNIYLHIHLFSC